MATIVRVKRRRCDDPVDNLVVSCKRKKEDTERDGATNADTTDLTSCLKFAGTVVSVNEGVSRKVREAIKKEKLTKEFKQHHVDVPGKARQWKKKATKEERFRVVSTFRSPQLDQLDEQTKTEEETNKAEKLTDTSKDKKNDTEESDKVFQLYDVELLVPEGPTFHSIIEESRSTSGITCNNVTMVREQVAEDDYVFDLYYTNNRDFSLQALESSLSFQNQTYDFSYNIDQDSDENEVYEDEDDSNDEGNWRNDYPDEDPHFIENQGAEYYYGGDVHEADAFEEDMRLSEWMDMRCNIEDENDLSSEDEDFAYFGQGLEPSTDGVHGYQEYYRRVTKEMNGDLEDVVNDDSSDCHD